MIPKEYNDVWEKGVEGGDYLIKLCGSGGGGFLLGFSRDFERAKRELTAQGIEPILVFKS